MPRRCDLKRWLERLTMAGMFVAFVMAGVLVWVAIFFRGIR